MVVEHGSRVKIAFTATYPDGELFDTSSREVAAEHGVDADKRFRPVVRSVGTGDRVAPRGLLGSEAGERETVDVPHEDLQLIYDRSEFESTVEESAEVGAEVHAKTGLLGEVVAVDEESVTVDFDPERAGQTLTFEVEVLEIE